jgi:hypothetical protein
MVVLLGLISLLGADGGAAAWKAKPVFVFAETDEALAQYALAKPANRAGLKGILKKVTVGSRAMAAVMLEDYELPYSRRIDVSADIVITDPTGREVLDKASVAGSRTMDPKTMVLVPLGPTFPLMFGLTDPEGEYRVHITVWDQVRGASTRLDTKFTLSR